MYVYNSIVFIQSTCTSIVTCIFLCLGHVCRVEDGRIPNDVLYSELASGAKRVGRPGLRLRDACKRGINLHRSDRVLWICCSRQEPLGTGCAERYVEEKERRKELGRRTETTAPLHQTVETCSICNRDCYSKIGMFSPNRLCVKRWRHVQRGFVIIRDRRMTMMYLILYSFYIMNFLCTIHSKAHRSVDCRTHPLMSVDKPEPYMESLEAVSNKHKWSQLLAHKWG